MRPRVLLLTHRVPYPPDRGDRIRSWHLLRQVARVGDVSLAALADEPVSPSTLAALGEHCENVCLAPLSKARRLLRGMRSLAMGHSISEGFFYSPQIESTIQSWHRQQPFDAVMVYCSSMFPYVAQAGLEDLPLFADLIDVDSQKWADYAARAPRFKSWLFRREAAAVTRLEQRVVAQAETVALTTPREAALLSQRSPGAAPIVMQNGVDARFFQPMPGAVAGRVVFVGVLNYWPNVQGVHWLLEHVWDRLRAAVPSATLEVVGRQPERSLRGYDGIRGVRICGDVADVRPHLAAAEVVVAPLQIARGVQNKVLEALAMERAVVATPPVCDGLAARPGTHLVQAATPTEWVDSLQALLQNPAERARLGQAGRALVLANHDWNHCLAPARQWIASRRPRTECADSTPAIVLAGGRR